MQHDPKAFLHDIMQACEEIEDFVGDMGLEEYCANRLVKAAVEREFLVIGEALTRLRHEFPEMLDAISDHAKAIRFRNVLAHGYDIIDDRTVWSAVRESLPGLRKDVRRLLDS